MPPDDENVIHRGELYEKVERFFTVKLWVALADDLLECTPGHVM